MIEERDGSNNLLTRYDYGDDIIRLDRSSGVYYYISDGLGSTRQLVDSTGAVQDSDTYDAFGNLAASSGNVPNWFLFNEQQLDPTGLYNLRARYMDPTRGEFLGQDPYPGNIFDPKTFNRYAYCGSDPVDFSDPTGKGDLGETLISTSIATSLIGATTGAIIGAARAYITDQNVWEGALLGGVEGGIVGAIPAAYLPVVINFGLVSGAMSISYDLIIEDDPNLALFDAGTLGLGAIGGLSKFTIGNYEVPQIPHDDFYNQVARKIPELDVSSKQSSILLYSGEGANDAAQFAADNLGYTIIDNTDGGKYLKKLNLFNNPRLDTDPDTRVKKALSLWGMLSLRFVNEGSGSVTALVNNPRNGAVYTTIERPAAENNSSITGITEYHPDKVTSLPKVR